MSTIPKKYRTVRKIQEGEFVAQIYNVNVNEEQKKFFINVHIWADDKPVIKMSKAYNVENGIVECTEIGQLVDEFELLDDDEVICWDNLIDLYVIADVRRSKSGKMYIHAIHPYVEDSDDEYSDSDYDED